MEGETSNDATMHNMYMYDQSKKSPAKTRYALVSIQYHTVGLRAADFRKEFDFQSPSNKEYLLNLMEWNSFHLHHILPTQGALQARRKRCLPRRR